MRTTINLRYHDIAKISLKDPKPPLGLIRLSAAQTKTPDQDLGMNGVANIRHWYHSYATRSSPDLKNLLMVKTVLCEKVSSNALTSSAPTLFTTPLAPSQSLKRTSTPVGNGTQTSCSTWNQKMHHY